MGVVSVNLSPRALRIYTERARRRDASRFISQAMCVYDNIRQDRDASPVPIVEPGDIRIMEDGLEYKWTDTGWNPIGGLKK